MNAAISGPAVRAAREAAKLSQNTVAQALGMNRMYYSLFEAGRYLLDESETKALRSFLESQGIDLESVEKKPELKVPAKASDQPSAKATETGEPTKENPSRTDAARTALMAVRSTVEESGVDSKRTAAAVASASAALRILDYSELLSVAESLEASMQGLVSEPDFALLPVEQKVIWESRAIGVLICDALYGEAWSATSCNEFRIIREALKKLTTDSEWHVRACGLWETDEKYLPDLRCQLAPYVAQAAESRGAPILSSQSGVAAESPPAKTSGWGLFP